FATHVSHDPWLCFLHFSANLHLLSFPTRRSSDLASELHRRADSVLQGQPGAAVHLPRESGFPHQERRRDRQMCWLRRLPPPRPRDRKSTRLNSSHVSISYAVFCLKKKKTK